MKKKILAILLTAVMCISVIGCTQTAAPAATAEAAAPVEQAQTTASPAVLSAVNTAAGVQDLLRAQPSILLNDAPAGSTGVAYCWLTNIPAISQITFTVDGCDYTYRAAASSSAMAALDISGVSQSFPSINTVELSKANVIGGSYLLKYDGTSGAGLASWYLPQTMCQYTLYTSNGCSGTMPLLKVMETLYNYTVDAKTAKGVVLDVNATNITITLENGSTSVLVLADFKLQDIVAGDSVDFSYMGDLGGNASLVSITKTGSSQQAKLSGSVPNFGKDYIYVVTEDNNAFLFDVDAATVITGVANQLTANCDVVVTYTGDLSDGPLAKTIEITKATPVPTPTPVPTAAPYVVRYADGYVTSAAGIYVTVAGEMFIVNSANCYVEGYAYEGAYAYITYKDYGGGSHEVTKAYFSDPIPDPDPYIKRTMAGYVDSVGGIYVTVNGVTFTVNSANCRIDGTPTVGCYAQVNYNDYGDGYYEVTYAFFDIGDVPLDYDWDEDYGDLTEDEMEDLAILLYLYGENLDDFEPITD